MREEWQQTLRNSWNVFLSRAQDLRRVRVGRPPVCGHPDCTRYGIYQFLARGADRTYVLHACEEHKPGDIGCAGCLS